MFPTLLKNARIYTPNRLIENGYVRFLDGRITEIGEAAALNPGEEEGIDVQGLHLVPGFIDIHVHGSAGFDVMDAASDDTVIDGLSKYLASKGTTSFLPTTTTSGKDELEAVVRGITRAIEQGTSGAEAIGIHLEGPFLNPVRKGAQNPQHMRNATVEEIDKLIEASGSRIKLVALAPELEGAMEVIRHLAGQGIRVSAAHTNASMQVMKEAAQAGLSQVTHMFNAMTPLHHREPGVAGAALMLDELAVEMICDGQHVDRDLIKFVFKAKPKDKVMLITDAVSPGGCEDGEYSFGGLDVLVKNGLVVLKDGNSLAGSSLTTEQAVRNAVNFTGMTLQEILPSITMNPARQIGVERYKGSLEVGKDADFVILDEEYRVVSTFVRGRKVIG